MTLVLGQSSQGEVKSKSICQRHALQQTRELCLSQGGQPTLDTENGNSPTSLLIGGVCHLAKRKDSSFRLDKPPK